MALGARYEHLQLTIRSLCAPRLRICTDVGDDYLRCLALRRQSIACYQRSVEKANTISDGSESSALRRRKMCRTRTRTRTRTSKDRPTHRLSWRTALTRRHASTGGPDRGWLKFAAYCGGEAGENRDFCKSPDKSNNLLRASLTLVRNYAHLSSTYPQLADISSRRHLRNGSRQTLASLSPGGDARLAPLSSQWSTIRSI